jgi:hypothetical protein
MPRYTLDTTFEQLNREIPSLGLSSGYYEVEGEIDWNIDGDSIEFVDIEITVRLLPEDPENENGFIWEWSSGVVHEDKDQNRRDHHRALEILESFGDADAKKAREGYTIADMIREEIEADNPDVNYVLRQYEC